MLQKLLLPFETFIKYSELNESNLALEGMGHIYREKQKPGCGKMERQKEFTNQLKVRNTPYVVESPVILQLKISSANKRGF